MTSILAKGCLSKMHVHGLPTPIYQLKFNKNASLEINSLLEQSITIKYSGRIFCHACDRKINKSYAQGYCYPCFRKLARCDTCMVRPETCHFHKGTCREEDWAKQQCFQDHIIYLANTSGLKVGITRLSQVPTRWIDQGAIAALPIIKVPNRLHSGLIESHLAKTLADKTNWRVMLKGNIKDIDLYQKRDALLLKQQQFLLNFHQQHHLVDDIVLKDEKVIHIEYPVRQYPNKIVSLNLDKQKEVTGTLQGIKGQYLIFDTGLINIRKFSGYEVSISKT